MRIDVPVLLHTTDDDPPISHTSTHFELTITAPRALHIAKPKAEAIPSSSSVERFMVIGVAHTVTKESKHSNTKLLILITHIYLK